MALMWQRKDNLEKVDGGVFVEEGAGGRKSSLVRRRNAEPSMAISWPSPVRTLVSAVQFCVFAVLFGCAVFGISWLTTACVGALL